MEKLYTVMYGEKNYFQHKMTEYENEISTALISKLKMTLSNDWGLDGLFIKFSNNIGYYVIEDNDRGHYSMYLGFPTTDSNEAFIILLDYGSSYQGFRCELKNRSQLEKEWRTHFKTKYDGRKFAFEYCLRKLSEVLGYIPDKYVEKYADYLNIREEIWRFDTLTKSFVEVCNTKK